MPSGASTASPSNTSSPASGTSRCSNRRARVDFPQPDSPTMPRVSPLRTLKETPSTAWTDLARALHRQILFEVAGDQQRLQRTAAVAGIEYGAVGHRRIHSGYIRTSIAARNPSLTRLKQIEVMKIATPGTAQTNGTM